VLNQRFNHVLWILRARRDLCETCRRNLDGFPPETQLHLRTYAFNGIRADFTRFSGSTPSLLPLFARGMRKAGCIMRTINQQDLPSGVRMSCDAGGISRSSGDPAREVLNSQPALENRIGRGLSTSTGSCASSGRGFSLERQWTTPLATLSLEKLGPSGVEAICWVLED